MLLGHHIEKMAAISIFLWIYRLSQKSWYATMPNNPAVFETSLHIYRSSGRHNELSPFIREVELSSSPFWRSKLFVINPFGIANTNAKKKCVKVCTKKN